MRSLPEPFSDRAFLLSPSAWPVANGTTIHYCCMKRGTFPNLEFGYILGEPKPYAPIRVLLGNIFDTESTLDEVNYDTVDDLLNDGWIVD